ncbi:MAG: hypothetical protein ACBR12_11765 [Microcoleus sp.]
MKFGSDLSDRRFTIHSFTAIQHLEKEMEVIIFVTVSQQPFPYQLGQKLMAAMCLGVE